MSAGCESSGTTDPTTTDGTSPTVYTITRDTSFVDSATVVAGTVIPVRVQVMFAGTPAPFFLVTWTVASGGGLLSSSTSTTDSLGYAAVLWTIGDTLGINTLTGVAGDASVTLQAMAMAGAGSVLQRISADSTFIVGGATQLLTVRVLDRHGNPVTGDSVTWSSSAGSLSTALSVTGATGNAEAAFTAPTSSGVSIVTATLPGKASVSFRVAHVYDPASGTIP